MKYQALCEAIFAKVGGKENIIDVSHCITRLRFHLVDESKADTAGLKATKGVVDVIQNGGQYQVVVGTQVEDIYKEFCDLYDFSKKPAVPVEAPADGKKSDPFSRLLGVISEIFQPVLGAVLAGGFIQSIMALAVLFGMDSSSTTYVVLQGIGKAIFYYFPITIAWSAGKKFGLKPAISMALGAVLVYPSIIGLATADNLQYTIAEGTIFQMSVYGDVFGIPAVLADYNSMVIPSIAIIWFAAKVHRFFSDHTPAVVSSIVANVCTLFIGGVVGLLVIGPVCTILSNIVAAVIQALIAFQPAVAGFVIGTFWSLLVMFGMHWGVIPLWFVNLAALGYDYINPLVYAGGCAILGACIGVIVRCKDKSRNADINIPAAVSSLFGVNEPALYGLLVPNKKLMWGTFLCAGVGGAIAGAFGARLYSMGASGPLGFPNFINPATGVDSHWIGLILSGVVAFVLAIVVSLILGKNDEKQTA